MKITAYELVKHLKKELGPLYSLGLHGTTSIENCESISENRT